MEWQPIETAPKNGDDLWLYQQGQEPEQFVGYFCSDGSIPGNSFEDMLKDSTSIESEAGG